MALLYFFTFIFVENVLVVLIMLIVLIYLSDLTSREAIAS